MNHPELQRLLPRFLRRHVLHFEALIDDHVHAFADGLPDRALVLDAGAGESVHAPYFTGKRYISLDLAVGDPSWNYRKLDVIADLNSLPLQTAAFDACLNVVTLEHICEPAAAIAEIHRILKPGGQLLLIVPHEWEVHQSPHDYFRYTRHGVAYLLEKTGFRDFSIQPAGGYFRLLARRLLNGLQFFPGLSALGAALLLVPPALILPFFDSLDTRRDFTLGYICIARKHG